MTPLHDKLRAALRETADEIPAEAPPLQLRPRPNAARNGRSTRWHAWTAPLAAAVLVIAAVAGSLTVAGSLKHQTAAAGPSADPYGIPAYYVALMTAKTQSDIENMLDSSTETGGAAELRSTQTGAVLAKIMPPKPYVSFVGVTAAADDRTFVLVAQGPQPRVEPPFPPQRFFLLRIDPAARAGARMTLTALPAGAVPAGSEVRDMAVSPDGTRLAAQISDNLFLAQDLDVFNLATGTERSWTTLSRGNFLPVSGGMLWFGVDTDALSWTSDSQHVAFIWDNTVRLLDTRAAGSDILTNSKTVATWTGGVQGLDQWRGAIITPDGQTVLGIESLSRAGRNAPVREHLVSWSTATATGRPTAVLNNLNALKRREFEQILYTSNDGRVLVLTYLQPGTNATIVRDGQSTAIPWSPYISVAAW